MQPLLLKELKPFLDAVAKTARLYVPRKTGEHYVFTSYDPDADIQPHFNNIRTCLPVKEFLFPLRQFASGAPETTEQIEIEPFAIFGLKDCDLRSIDALDRVFLEDEFRDPFYAARRENMFIISGDCFDLGESCCCNLFNGRPFAKTGFDLNLSKTDSGYIVEVGSKKGEDFLNKNSELFTKAPDEALQQREQNRKDAQQQLEQNTAAFKLDAPVREIMTAADESDVFDTEAEKCVECQACTRVCPTCHCFYLYDTNRKDYFTKMMMWDSCLRRDYARVAGDANPRKILGDRLRHRLMHKFVYFLDRYGIEMCVGCGRCVDACAGGIDIRRILKKLNEELKDKSQVKVAK